MAYAALLSFTRTLENILLSCDESLLVLDEELQIKSLQEKLGLFISFLEETSQKNSKPIEDLEEKIRDVVYEAEDIIESHMSKQIHPGGSRNLSSTGWYIQNIKSIKVLYNFFKFFYTRFPDVFWPPFLSRSEASTKDGTSIADSKESDGDATYETKNTGSSKEINNEEDLDKKNNEIGLKNVRGKLASLWEEVEKMTVENNIEALQIKNPATPVKVDSTSSEIRVDEIVEEEKMQSRNVSSSKSASTNKRESVMFLEDNILRINELLDRSSGQLETIRIVGMGGIGKTTLARSIYAQQFVSSHFDVRAWITVSREYNLVALLKNLLKSMGKDTSENNGERLKLKVYQNLKQRRYFIIMDDIWDTNFLEEFKNILPDDNMGSRIIITSRSSKVANFEHYSSHVHSMNFLSPEQSWNLLRQKALGKESCPPEVERIGRKIAEKCKGLPLSLVVVGGLLYKGKKTRKQWEYVEKNMKSTEVGNYDDLMEILSWSYKHLPLHLKACFLYMAIYPEDYVIHASHLMRLWLAEGFIKSIPPKNFEQAAKEYLEELIDRNLIIVRDQSYYGEVKTCTIHDLTRELCIRIAREEMFLHSMDKDKDDKEAIKNPRFLSIYGWSRFKSAESRFPTVRSRMYFKGAYPLTTYMDSPLLRVLDACYIRLARFPIEIIKFVNLIYLALFIGQQECDLASISRLCNLQTLIITREIYFFPPARPIYLPSEMTKMQWLRHLQVDGCKFTSFDSGAPNWKLQVLSGLNDFQFTMDAIEKICDIKILGIVFGIFDKIASSEYHLENLVHLHQLEKLKVKCDTDHSVIDLLQLPPNLSFPQNLKELTLKGFKLSWKELSMIGSHSNLQVMKLKYVNFENNVWKTNEGEFNGLKFLLIESHWWEYWEAEGAHFPSLECLSLRNCESLNCIPREIGELPTLRGIVLCGCSQGVVDSATEILKEQHEYGNESFQLHEGSGTGISFRESCLSSW